MRIFAASLATETNMFSPIPTAVENFYTAFYAAAGEHPDYPTLCSAPLWVARQRARAEGWTLIEGSSAWAEPAGTCARAAYEHFRDEIIDQLRAALPVDGVLLGLHGAMVAHGYDDCEGDLLVRVRDIAGADAVIGVEHDLHCHLTEKRLSMCDILITFKEFPHTDAVARAEELITLTTRTIKGEIRPVMSVVDCRTIASYPTTRQPMRDFVDKLQALEGRDGILSISVAHGFPFADVAEMGTRVLVMSDDAKAEGDRLAATLAAELVAMRGRSAPPFLTIGQALERALDHSGDKPLLIADPTDNPGGGAPGDATHLLREFIARDVAGVALAPMWDPVAVALCHAAGLGATLQLRFGGKTAVASGLPVDAEVEIKALAKDAHQRFSGGNVALGDTALIRLTGTTIDVVLITKRTQALGRELFTHLGFDLHAPRIICLKSTNHFHAAFAPLAEEVVYCDAGGPLPRDVRKVAYQKVRRPIWPLDETAEPMTVM